MIRATLAILILLGARPGPAPVQAAQPEKYPASKHLWMRWKPGTSVSYALTQQVPTAKHEGEMVFLLREVTAEGYVINVKSRLPGFEQEQAEKETVAEKVGPDKVTVAGKEHPATVWKSSGRRGDAATERRAWLIEGVGVPVRIVSKTQNEEFELAASSLKEDVTAAGKKLSCVRLSGRMKTAQGEAEITVWMSDQIPGGAARMETVAQEGQVRVTLEATQILEPK